MLKVLLVLASTALSFFLLRNKTRQNPNEEPKIAAQIGLIFFLLIIFIGIFFWLDITALLTNSSNATSNKEGGNSSKKLSAEDYNVLERNLISNIREDVDVGIPPF